MGALGSITTCKLIHFHAGDISRVALSSRFVLRRVAKLHLQEGTKLTPSSCLLPRIPSHYITSHGIISHCHNAT